jgi:hypothetical protein
MTIDLTAATQKGRIGLYLSREIAFDVQAKAGIKVTPDRSYSSNTGYRYTITQAAARKLVAAYGTQGMRFIKRNTVQLSLALVQSLVEQSKGLYFLRHINGFTPFAPRY